MSAAKFRPGRIVATPAALMRAEEHGINVTTLLARHLTGDWGDLDEHDRQMNEDALANGSRLLSAYGSGETKLYVITEWDRSATTVLRPEDY